MKIIKWIFRIILILLLLLVVSSIVLLVVMYDNSDLDYDTTKEVDKMENVIGKDVSNSLDTIYETNYDSDSNRINIGVSSDTLNDYFFELVRTSVDGASTYYDGTQNQMTYIISNNNVKLNSIEFYINTDKTLACRARFDLFGYKTSIYISADVSIKSAMQLKNLGATYSGSDDDNHILNIEFSKMRFGSNLSISSSIVKDIFNKLSLKFNTGEVNFDVNRLAFYFNLDEIIKKSCPDEFLLSVIEACDYDVSIEKLSSDTEEKLYLSVNTEDLFMEKQEIIAGNKDSAEAKITAKIPEVVASPYEEHIISLTEEELNGYIASYINNNLSSFNKSITIGNSVINMTISDAAYSISNNAILSNILFNNAASPAKIYTSIENNYDSANYLESLEISVTDVKLGTDSNAGLLTNSLGENISSIVLNIDDIFTSTYKNYIKDITFDKENSTCNIKLQYRG